MLQRFCCFVPFRSSRFLSVPLKIMSQRTSEHCSPSSSLTPSTALEMLYSVFKSVRHRIAMLYSLRYILPVVVLLIFGGWVYSDDIPKPDLGSAIQNLQNTLSQLQNEIKDLQSSVKKLARGAKEARKEKAA